MADSLYWYDFETTGVDPARDRVLQFAGVRTDLALNPIGEPLNLFCYPGDDVVPDPEAMLVTGLNMETIKREGLIEAEFARRILAEFSVPQTCVVGFNSIRFDDEFTRYLLYRNFYDPYGREWQAGNSRWDVIDMFRMAHALRPDGFNWPKRDTGVPTFRLEALTAANGVGHQNAHDAVADVLATIDVVKRLQSAQPKLYDYLYRLRSKKAVLQRLYPLGKQAIVHVSSMYPASRHCLAVVLPLCVHPTNPNGIICFDLANAPDGLIEVGPDELERRIFTRREDLEAGVERIGLKTIHVNRAPAIAPLNTISGREAELGIRLEDCLAHQRQLQTASGIVEKITEVFSRSNFETTNDPDLMLYQGEFFSRQDREVMDAIHESRPDQLPAYASQFQDSRLPEMLFRFRARNFPDSLTADELAQWQVRRQQLFAESLNKTRLSKLNDLLTNEPESPVLKALDTYLSSIGARQES